MIQGFMICEDESSMNVVCFLILLAREFENEFDLSLYSLKSKTSRYAYFGHNQLTVYGIQLAAFMLLLHQKFEFQSIRHTALHIWIAAFKIRIAIYDLEAYCPKFSLPLVKSGQPLATITATVNYFLKLQFYPKTFHNCTMAHNVINFMNRSNFRISK